MKLFTMNLSLALALGYIIFMGLSLAEPVQGYVKHNSTFVGPYIRTEPMPHYNSAPNVIIQEAPIEQPRVEFQLQPEKPLPDMSGYSKMNTQERTNFILNNF